MDTNIELCLTLCEKSYDDNNILETNYKNNNLIIFNKEDAKGFSIELNNILYICWRGSYNVTNFIRDIEILDKKELFLNDKFCGKIHRGFFDYYNLLKENTINIVKQTKCKKIIFTGHSLGASILISALELKLLNPNNNIDISTITFGSPKLGNNDFVKIFNTEISNSLRIYDSDDVVSKSPLGLNYYHVDKPLKLINKTYYSWTKVLIGLINILFLKKIIKKNELYFHTIENYKKKINLLTVLK